MNLLKTSFLSGISALIRTISGLVLTKVIAIYIGPSGMAIIGQLQNFINIVMLSAGNFLKTPVTKYTAEYKEDKEVKYDIWSASVKIILSLNLIIFFPLFFFSEEISQLLLNETKYAYVLKVFAISLPFFVLNTLLLSILNGHKQIKKYITLQIALSILSLILVVLLSIFFGLYGALFAYVTNQSIVFLFTFFYLKKESWFEVKNFTRKIKLENIKKLSGYALITIVAVLSSNSSMLLIRDFISEEASLVEAGYWQAIWSLSQISLNMITLSLTTYYLPTMAALIKKKEITKELKKTFKTIFPIVFIISLAFFFLREFIVLILYTEEFLPMVDLFFWQMMGNVVKVTAWLFGYILVAKAMVKHTTLSEVFLAITFVLMTFFLVKKYGIIGATYSYLINSFFHLIMMVYIYKFKVKDE